MTSCIHRLLLVVLLAGGQALAEAAESVPAGQTEQPAVFLQSVIGRIGGQQELTATTAALDLARPVADLKAALARVSQTMAADQSGSGSQSDDLVVFPSDGPPMDGPPFVLAPPGDTAPSGPEVGGGPPAPSPIQAPPLSKHELSAVYQAVANKGLQLDLASVQGGYIPNQPGQPSLLPADPAAGENAGYYYYFFPIKDLGGDLKSQQGLQPAPSGGGATGGGGFGGGGGGGGGGGPSMSPMDQAAAMNVMASLANGDENGLMGGGGDAQKSVEPLFMAMSGFIGMALMFVLSVLFLPKWGALRSRGVTALKHAPDELASLTKLVVQSIEGKDCSERIACEVGRAVRTMHLGNKPLRVLEIILPPHLSKQIGHIRKAARKAEKCNFIPCKYPAWYTSSLKPPYKPPLLNKLPPYKLLPPATQPPPPPLPPPSTTPPSTASRSTPRSRPLPHIKLILSNGNKNNPQDKKNNNNNNNNAKADSKDNKNNGKQTPSAAKNKRLNTNNSNKNNTNNSNKNNTNNSNNNKNNNSNNNDNSNNSNNNKDKKRRVTRTSTVTPML